MKISEVLDNIYLLTEYLNLGKYQDTSVLINRDFINIVDKNQFIYFDNEGQKVLILNNQVYDKLSASHNNEVITVESFMPLIEILFILAQNRFNTLSKLKIEYIFEISEFYKENQYAKKFRKLVLLL